MSPFDFIPKLRLKTILRELRKQIVSLRISLFLYALACSFAFQLVLTPAASARAQVFLHQIRQYLANLLFGRGVLHG